MFSKYTKAKYVNAELKTKGYQEIRNYQLAQITIA